MSNSLDDLLKDSHGDLTVGVIVFMIGWVMGFLLVCGPAFNAGRNEATQSLQKEIVSRGYGHFVLDQTNGTVVFKWKD